MGEQRLQSPRESVLYAAAVVDGRDHRSGGFRSRRRRDQLPRSRERESRSGEISPTVRRGYSVDDGCERRVQRRVREGGGGGFGKQGCCRGRGGEPLPLRRGGGARGGGCF